MIELESRKTFGCWGLEVGGSWNSEFGMWNAEVTKDEGRWTMDERMTKKAKMLYDVYEHIFARPKR